MSNQDEGSDGRLVCGDAIAGGKEALFVHVAGVREKRREQGQDEVKPIVIDVKKAHLNAKCDEEEVRTAGRIQEVWEVFPSDVMAAASRWEDDHAKRLMNDGIQPCACPTP